MSLFVLASSLLYNTEKSLINKSLLPSILHLKRARFFPPKKPHDLISVTSQHLQKILDYIFCTNIDPAAVERDERYIISVGNFSDGHAFGPNICRCPFHSELSCCCSLLHSQGIERKKGRKEPNRIARVLFTSPVTATHKLKVLFSFSKEKKEAFSPRFYFLSGSSDPSSGFPGIEKKNLYNAANVICFW